MHQILSLKAVGKNFFFRTAKKNPPDVDLAFFYGLFSLSNGSEGPSCSAIFRNFATETARMRCLESVGSRGASALCSFGSTSLLYHLFKK